MVATWTDPSDQATSHKVTAAEWNTLLGTNGTLAACKGAATSACTQTDVTSSRLIDGTVYPNTSGKIKTVTVCVYCVVPASQTNAVSRIEVYTDATATPTQLIGYAGLDTVTTPAGLTLGMDDTITFDVKPSNYYKVVSTSANGGSAPVKTKWNEWTNY